MKISQKKSWKEISIREYQSIVGILEDQTLLKDEIELNNYLIAITANLSITQVRELPLTTWKEMVSNLNFLKTHPTAKIKNSYVINNKTYITTKKLSEVTSGQYIDLQNLTKNPDTIIENLESILAIFLIRKGETYGSYDMQETIEDIGNHLSIEDALALSSFFFSLSERLWNCSLSYLKKMKKKAEKTQRKLKKDLRKPGASS